MKRRDKQILRLRLLLSPAVTPHPDWSKVRALMLSLVDVSMDPKRGSDNIWPIARDVIRGPHSLVKELVRLGMPLFPRCQPELVLQNAILWANLDNLRLLLQHAPAMKWLEGSRSLCKSPLELWASGGTGAAYPPFSAPKWQRMLQMLLRSGANIDMYDKWGRTPLLFCLVMHTDVNDDVHWARGDVLEKHEYLDRAKMLIQAGADVNLPMAAKGYELGGRWPIGATPLFARPFGNGTLHRALLRAKADPLKRCLKPVPWNAIEFAEMTLERLEKHAAEYVYTPTGKRLTFTEPPLKDDPKVVRSIISQMKRVAATRHQ